MTCSTSTLHSKRRFTRTFAHCPFSAVVMVNMLALVFISLGRLRGPAVATAVIGIGPPPDAWS